MTEPSELQLCIDLVEQGQRHDVCCCANKQRCLVAVRYAVRRLLARGFSPAAIVKRIES